MFGVFCNVIIFRYWFFCLCFLIGWLYGLIKVFGRNYGIGFDLLFYIGGNS